MKSTSKWFLVSFFLLFTMGAMAQTVTNRQATAVQANAPTVSATEEPAKLDGPAALFMLHLQNQGLPDPLVTGLKASFAKKTYVVPGLLSCPGQECEADGVCTGGSVCGDCAGVVMCTSTAVCRRQCDE
jgi:hypothetical protein